MTSAYGSNTTEIIKRKTFKNLPEQLILPKTGQSLIFDVYNASIDREGLYSIFEEVVEEGTTYPQDYTNIECFDAYFPSHDCFVFRLASNNQTIGGFYIKPNFPGRSSHLANFGLIIKKDFRGKGLGGLMMERCVRMGRELPYEALYTNLVFETNTASITLCKRFGCVAVGRLPRAGNLKGLGYVDAFQFYLNLRQNI